MRNKLIIMALSMLICFAGLIRTEPQAEVQPMIVVAQDIPEPEVIETIIVEPEQVPEPTYNLCDVPMDAELQMWIFDYCKERQISPYLIFAMCERESRYTADAVGDNGNSLGIMQVQPRWHSERMQELGCNDLLDARQNITVGIDYLLELADINEDIGWVLMAYNGGQAYANKMCKDGRLSEYADYILTRAEEMEVSAE